MKLSGSAALSVQAADGRQQHQAILALIVATGAAATAAGTAIIVFLATRW